MAVPYVDSVHDCPPRAPLAKSLQAWTIFSPEGHDSPHGKVDPGSWPHRGAEEPPQVDPASTQAPRTSFRKRRGETMVYSQGVGDRAGSAARL